MEYIISGERIETMNLALDKLEMRLNPHECPRVIRCRDRKHYGGPPFYGANMAYCMMHQSMLKDPNGFCAWAEPREES